MNTNIRPATLDDCTTLAHIQVDSYLSTYAGILPPAYLVHFTYQEQEQDWRDWLVSNRDGPLLVGFTPAGQVVGYALGGRASLAGQPYEGELVALHVRREHRGQGWGRALFHALSQALQVQGCRGLFCWVLADNPACGFYERLGGQRVAEKPWENNPDFGTEVVEVAYGWEAVPREVRTHSPSAS